MTTSALPLSSVRTAFEKLIDYAGLFPPAGLAMSQALCEFETARNGSEQWMLARFVVPLSRIPELLQACDSVELSAPLPLSVIVDGDLAAVAEQSDGRIRIEMLEAAAKQEDTGHFDSSMENFARSLSDSGLAGLPVFVELPQGLAGEPAPLLEALRRNGLLLKIRCGGQTAQAFPTPASLAATLAAAAAAHLPFKATAGLHHPIRRRDSVSGFTMHGFLNLLTASAVAGESSVSDIAAILDDQSAEDFAFNQDSLVWRGLRIGTERLAAMRAFFLSYGSCSVEEPSADLRALSLIS